MQAGMVMVNLPTAGVDYHVPFGGRKGSSYGPREQGRYAAEFYTTVKTAYTNARGPCGRDDRAGQAGARNRFCEFCTMAEGIPWETTSTILRYLLGATPCTLAKNREKLPAVSKPSSSAIS